MRYLHTMVRVSDLAAALDFYCGGLGLTEVRRMERSILAEYEQALDTIAAKLSRENRADAVAIAELPRAVRGYEQLKLTRAAAFRRELASAMLRWA